MGSIHTIGEFLESSEQGFIDQHLDQEGQDTLALTRRLNPEQEIPESLKILQEAIAALQTYSNDPAHPRIEQMES